MPVPPPPPRWIARLLPRMGVKNTGAWTVKENMLYSVGARVLDVSMVIAAWGEGVNVCLCPRPPPRLISKKGQKYFGGPLVFPTHVCDSAPSLVYMIGLKTKNCNNIGFGFSFMKIYVLRICNVQ